MSEKEQKKTSIVGDDPKDESVEDELKRTIAEEEEAEDQDDADDEAKDDSEAEDEADDEDSGDDSEEDAAADDDIDYEKELELEKAKRGIEIEKRKRTAAALNEERRRRKQAEAKAKDDKSDADQDEDDDDKGDTKKSESDVEVVKREIAKDFIDEAIEAVATSKAHADLIRIHFERLYDGTISRKQIQAIVDDAAFLADRRKYVAKAESKARKGFAEKTAIERASGKVSPKAAASKTKITAEDRAIARMVGMTPEKYVQYKKHLR